MRMQHVTIQTEAFEQEIAFYEKYVGLTIARDMSAAEQPIVFLADAAGGTEVEIIRRSGAAASGSEYLSVGFHCEDLDGLRQRMADDGLTPTPFVEHGPVRFFFVKDPAGVTVQFI